MKYDNKKPNLLPDEPWFLIRGRDALALDAIGAYADLAAKESSKREPMSPEGIALMQHALQILKIKEQFMDWQDANQDKVRMPKPEERSSAQDKCGGEK